tara:strand:- start:463 stop:1218 length:756 start_codon:yes stop_codon:yes gene_type:complete
VRIVSWNCSGGLRNKLHATDRLNSDVLIVQECEDPSRSISAYHQWAGNYLWVGDSKNKGIGVFAKNGHKVKKLDWSSEYTLAIGYSKSHALTWRTDDLKLFLPFTIDDKINVLAVWSKGIDSHKFGYIGQIWKYIQLHRVDICRHKTIILGDFNSNSRWDRSDCWWNHSDVVGELEEMGFESQYHKQADERQGEESIPTFLMHRKVERPYHIDYIFTSTDMKNSSELTIGDMVDWLSLSDHMPLTLDWCEG